MKLWLVMMKMIIKIHHINTTQINLDLDIYPDLHTYNEDKTCLNDV